MFEKVTNISEDRVSKRNLVHCFFFGDRISIDRQNLFSLKSLMSVPQYENTADKHKISNLYFMFVILYFSCLNK